MAEIKLHRQVAASGQLPNVCLCCGAPATQWVQHKFYLRSTGILIAMLLLGRMRWLFLPQSYEYTEFRVPLCGFHRHRLSLHTYLLIGFAVLGLLCVPVLLIGSINKDYLWVTEIGLVAFLLLFPVMFITVLTVMILTPRLVEHSTMSLKLVSVSNGFAQAVGSGGLQGLRPAPGFEKASPLPGIPAGAGSNGFSADMFAGFNLTVGLVTALTCVLSLMEFGVIYFGKSIMSASVTQLSPVKNQAEWDDFNKQVRSRQRAELERQMAEANRHVQPPPVTPPPYPNTPNLPPYSPPPTPVPRPPTTPAPATPSSDPDHWDNVRRWKSESGIELGRGRLVSRDGDYIVVTYRRSTSSTMRERRLPIRSLSKVDQEFVRSQFPDPPPSQAPQLTGETRPGGKLSPTNENNQNFVPPATGTKPGFEVTNAAQVRAGDKVHIFWAGSWYPGVVLGTEHGLIKVHYDNHPDHWDELAALRRVRTVNATGASSPIPPPVPSPAPPTPAPVPTPEAPPAEMRTWTDSTGKFKLIAKLIALENGNVKLEREDGKIVTMPLDKLSPADQVAVRARFP